MKRDSRAFISSDEEEGNQRKFESRVFKNDHEIEVRDDVGQSLMERYGFGHIEGKEEKESRRLRSGSGEAEYRRSRSRERKERYYKRAEPKEGRGAGGSRSASSAS